VSTNVLLITPYSFTKYGGVQNQVNLIEDYLDKHSEFNVKVFAHGKIEILRNEKIFNIPFNSSVSSVMLFPNRKILKEHIMWADVIHVHEPFVPIIFWRIPKNKKYVFTHHASLNQVVVFLLKTIYKLFTFNSMSTYVSDDAKSNALALSQSSELIPNMIEINNDASFSKSNGFLFIGRDEKRKNIKFFKMLSIKDAFKNSKFIAITNKILDTNNIVSYVNPTNDEKNQIFKKTNIYLALNTKSESFGITILEAVNNGNLAVTSSLDAFINVLKDSHVTFINNNFSSLQEVLLNLRENKLSDLWEKQFNEIKKYDLLKNMEKFIYIYSKL
tara:strand:+ start:2017 stop:3006 length:990 start_codon:yes stop_codon:yes gene_type:complete